MGHVPLGESKELKFFTFEEAREKGSREVEYDEEKWIYIPNFYSEYRYILGTKGKNPLVTVGINPSTAEPNRLDNTVRTVERMALRNGYDSFVMFNVYAQRATKPENMDRLLNEKLHRENMEAFRWLLKIIGKEANIWAAWGAIIEKRSYLKNCLEDMVKIGEAYQARWIRAGELLKAGHPHHPLYLRKDSKFEEFKIKEYVEDLIKGNH